MFEVGILNAETGDPIMRKVAPGSLEEVMEQAQYVSQWFDRWDTCYAGRPIWLQWHETGAVTPHIRSLVNGTAREVSETVMVFGEGGGGGVEFEFYVKRR